MRVPCNACLGSRNFNELTGRRGRWNRLAVLGHPFQMKFDGLADQSENFFSCFASGHIPGNRGHTHQKMMNPSPRRRDIALLFTPISLFLQASLLQGTVQCSDWNVDAELAGNRNRSPACRVTPSQLRG